ncbi:MAG: hypothetical protein V1720_06195 [bacterium]
MMLKQNCKTKRILLLSCFLVLLFNFCKNSTDNSTHILPELNEIDKMLLKDMLKYTSSNVDPFDKNTTYYLDLYNEISVRNKYAICMIDSEGASLVIQPDVYVSNDPQVKIVSAHKHVHEFGTMGINNTFYLGIPFHIDYIKDGDVVIRFTGDYNVFDLLFDKNEERGIYMAYRIYKKLSNN